MAYEYGVNAANTLLIGLLFHTSKDNINHLYFCLLDSR